MKKLREEIENILADYALLLDDLEGIDQLQATDAILTLIDNHTKEYGRDILLRLKKPFGGAYIGNNEYDWEKLAELFEEEFKDLKLSQKVK